MPRSLILDVEERRHGDALAGEADDLDRTAVAAERAGKNMEGMGRQSSRLDEEVQRLTKHIHEVRTEVDRTGRFELLDEKGFREDQRRLSQLTRTLKALGPEAGDAVGRGVFGGITDALATGAAASRGALIAVLVGGAVAAAPLIGAAIAGAVTGAVGLGGIAGGIALAAQDTQVQQAAQRLGRELMQDLTADARVFVDPTVKGLRELANVWHDIEPDIARDFQTLAPGVEAFARGVGGLVHELQPGLSKAFEAAVPALVVLGEELPKLGAAVGAFLEDVTGSDAALVGLRATLMIVDAAIVGLGMTIRVLEEIFKGAVIAIEKVSGALEDIPVPEANEAFAAINDITERWLGNNIVLARAVNQTSQETWALSKAIAGVEQGFGEAITTLDTFIYGVDRLIQKELALDDANINWQQSLDDLAEELKTGKRTLDINSQAGRDNARAILEAVGAAERLRQDMITKTPTAVGKANAEYQKAIDKIYAMGRQAGLSKRQLDDLVGKYRIDIEVAVHGLGAALAGVLKKFPGFAAGGRPPTDGSWFLVGEAGPEPMRIRNGQPEVLPASHTPTLLGGGDTYNVTINVDAGVSDPLAVAEKIRQVLRQLKRSKGGVDLGIG